MSHHTRRWQPPPPQDAAQMRLWGESPRSSPDITPLPVGPAPTSRRAAQAAEPAANTRARQVLDWLTARGRDGATRDEIADGLGLPIQSVCPVVAQLVRLGYVVATDRERPTRLGRAAQVLVARSVLDREEGWG